MMEIVIVNKKGAEVFRGDVNDYVIKWENSKVEIVKERRKDPRFNREIVRPTYDTYDEAEGLNPKGPKYLWI